MTVETFFEKFALFADAPDSIEKMRELVLRLAFSGGLTGKRLGKDGVPEGWGAQTIASICSSLTPGFACSRSHQTENGHVHLRTHNVSILGTLNFDLLVRIDPRKVDSQKSAIRKGDILFNNTNSQELVGKTALVDRDYNYGFSNHITRLRLQSGVLPGFVALYLTMLRNSGHFAKLCTRWINQAAVNTDTLKKEVILLPPLAEQARIVAKVDELMALCDRLEAQQQERETQHAALARASLARFAEAPTPANLDFLFHKSYAIPPADLRKSILTLAVQGKLVPQDPNDEPAEELLARLVQERTRISKERGVRPLKNVLPLTAGNCPHDIPESWQWSRIGHIALVIDYGTSQKADNDSSKVPVYRMGNIVGGRLVDENLKYVDASIDDLPKLYLKNDDILFNRTNSYELVGKAGIYTGPDDTATFASYLIRIRLPEALLFPPFYSVAMNAPYFRQTQIEPEVVQQCGQANFNGTKLASTVVPVPPLAEQRRIVAKVDELMALVDALETQLAASRATSAKLLDAIVAELTKPLEKLVPARPVIETRMYLVQFVAALLANVRRPIFIHELTRVVAFLFLPNRLLPLAESVGGVAARRHFENFAQANTDGILSDALRVLHRAGAISYVPQEWAYLVKFHSAKAPPADPIIEQDGKYMADILELLPAEESDSAMEAQVQQLEEELFPTM